ncbi:MAG: hypothetical protein VB106_15010, partial [Clostridiaceae bacterium]|nr:hypothetical protein [Clostridiaceae bacterium]
MKRKNGIVYFFVNLFLVIFAITVLVPVIYMVIISFSKNVMSIDSGILPKEYTLQNYEDLFSKHQFKNWIMNSVIISLGTMALTAILATIGSYVFSRLEFWGSRITFKSILLIQIFPITLSMVAMHRILGSMGLLNNLLGLILVDTVMALPYSMLL